MSITPGPVPTQTLLDLSRAGGLTTHAENTSCILSTDELPSFCSSIWTWSWTEPFAQFATTYAPTYPGEESCSPLGRLFMRQCSPTHTGTICPTGFSMVPPKYTILGMITATCCPSNTIPLTIDSFFDACAIWDSSTLTATTTIQGNGTTTILPTTTEAWHITSYHARYHLAVTAETTTGSSMIPLATSSTSTTTSNSNILTTGERAGIIVGSVATATIAIAVAFLIYLFWKRRKPGSEKNPAELDGTAVEKHDKMPEISGGNIFELRDPKSPMMIHGWERQELDDTSAPVEIGEGGKSPVEKGDDDISVHIQHVKVAEEIEHKEEPVEITPKNLIEYP